VLISLASATGLLKPAFGKKELAGRKARIARIVEGELAGRATREAIEAMQAAMFVAVFVPVIIT
jgi:cytochrome P450